MKPRYLVAKISADRTLNNPLLLRRGQTFSLPARNRGRNSIRFNPFNFSLYKFNYRSSIPILPLHLSSSSTFNIDIVGGKRDRRLSRRFSFQLCRNRAPIENVLEQINRQLESVVTIFKRDVSKRVGAFVSDEGERFDRVNPYTHPFCLNVQRLNRLMPTFRRLRFRLPFR